MICKSDFCTDGGPLATSRAQRYITNELKVPPGESSPMAAEPRIGVQ